jgi:hypothetical protein
MRKRVLNFMLTPRASGIPIHIYTKALILLASALATTSSPTRNVASSTAERHLQSHERRVDDAASRRRDRARS